MNEQKQWQEVLEYAERQMKHYGITKKELSERTQIPQSNMSKIFSRKIIPSTVKWIKIHNGILTIIALRESVSESLKTSHNENN